MKEKKSPKPQPAGNTYSAALRNTWFDQAIQGKDLGRARMAIKMMPEPTAEQARQIKQLEESFSNLVTGQLKKCSDALQDAQELLKQKGGPSRNFEAINQAIQHLESARTLAEEWGQRAQEADMNRGVKLFQEKGKELQALLEHMRAHRRALENYRESRIRRIQSLWLLVSPGRPEDPADEPRQTPVASLHDRRIWLTQMGVACNELLQNYSQDEQTSQWKFWQARIADELHQLPAEGRGINLKPIFLLGIGLALLVIGYLGGCTAGRIIDGPDESGSPSPSIMTTEPQRGTEASPTPMVTSTLTLTPTVTPTFTTTPTPTPTVTATDIPVPTSILNVEITFPSEGSVFPVFPWQIVITSDNPVDLTIQLESVTPGNTPLSITLAGTVYQLPIPIVLNQYIQTGVVDPDPATSAPYTYYWTREVNDLLELPDGEYKIVVTAANDPGRLVCSIKIDTTIASLSQNALYPLSVYRNPSGNAEEIVNINVVKGETVRIFGVVEYIASGGGVYNVTGNGPEKWCYFKVADSNQSISRVGWARCYQIAVIATFDGYLELAPPIPESLYNNGGKP